MCRMLAKVSPRPTSPQYEVLEAPHCLRAQSLCANQLTTPTGPHPSGCGVAWATDGDVHIEKRGAADRWNESFIATVQRIRSRFAVAHIRSASPDLAVDAACAHPYRGEFRGRGLAFCHIGGIDSLYPEARRLHTSDSELFMNAILERISAVSTRDLAQALRGLEARWSYNSLTALLLSPDAVFAWRLFDERAADRFNLERFITLYIKDTRHEVCIASEPIDDSGLWRALPNRAFGAWRVSGEEVLTEELTL